MATANFEKVHPHQEMYKKLCFGRIKKARYENTGREQTDATVVNYLQNVAVELSGGYRLAMLQQAYPGIVELLRNVKVAVDTNTHPDAFVSHVRPLVYDRFKLCEEDQDIKESDLFELHRKIYSLMMFVSSDKDQSRKKSKVILWQADRQKDTLAKHLPSILEKGYGAEGVSIASLFDKHIDINTAGNRLLTIISGLPKGDTFTQSFLREVFFFEPDSDSALDGSTYFNDRGRTERIMEMQMWLANKLIGPSINDAGADGGFDTQSVSALGQLDMFGVSRLGRMVQRAYNKSAETRAMFVKGKPLSDIISDLSIPPEVRNQITSETTPEEVRYLLMTYLNTHSDAVIQNWRTRFFADYDKKMKPFENSFMLLITPPIQPREEIVDVVPEPEVETNPVTEFLQSRMNTQLIEHLKIDQAELKEVQDDVWRKAKEGRKMNYWLHPEGTYRIEFEQKTAMRIAGLRELQVTADPTKSAGTIEESTQSDAA